MELADKKTGSIIKQNIIELRAIPTKFWLWGKDSCFLCGESIPRGSVIPKNTSLSPPKQLKQVKAAEKPDNLEKELQNLLLTPIYRRKQLQNNFYASGEMLFCKFCQHVVDWKRSRYVQRVLSF